MVFTTIKNWLFNTAARQVGNIENDFPKLRYPVKSYVASVDGRLWRGSRPNPKTLAKLKESGFGSVIDLRSEATPAEFQEVSNAGLESLSIPVTDNTCPTALQLSLFLFLIRSHQKPVFVHCEAGIGRTGVFCAAYRVATGWTPARALIEAQSFGLSLPCQVDFIRSLKPNGQTENSENGNGTH